MAVTLEKVVAHVRRLSDVGGGSDGELLERFALAADESAFAELVRRHGPMVLAVCRRVLRHEQDAEDAFQAAFLVLARKAGTIRRDGSVGGWLYQVAQRIAVRAKALAERRRMTQLLSDYPAPPASAWDALDEELAQLPEPYRSAIVLCYLEGKTQVEAARLLDTTAHAVNSRLKRARELLRHRLARHGVMLSAIGIATLIASSAQAAISPDRMFDVTHAAIQFALDPAASTTHAATLAQGALQTMIPTNLKLMSVFVAALVLLVCGALWMPSAANDDPAKAALNPPPLVEQPAKKPDQPAKATRHCIILWLGGGPSQIDTFDPKAGKTALFKAIDTNVKGVQFSELLPNLAKQANHLAVIRSMTHREGDHNRATFLMHTANTPGGAAYPSLGCVLAKELGGRAEIPRFVAIDAADTGPGILGNEYAPLRVGGKHPFIPADGTPDLPAQEAFDAIDKDKGAAMRKNLAKAFELADEKDALRDAYGKSRFGEACLIARRMTEQGVAVVEVTLGGWDTHADAPNGTNRPASQLDAAFAALVKDLHERKRLDQTLIVCMGEFGRTPRINLSKGRDHYPMAFSVVLAGAGIKGGQAIGKTSDDGMQVTERATSPQELFATIYRSLSIDPHKGTKLAGGQVVPYVEKENSAVKEALR